jgi:hypothetical protein
LKKKNDDDTIVRDFLSADELVRAQTSFSALCAGAYAIPGNDFGEQTPGFVNVTTFSHHHALNAIEDGVLDTKCLELAENLYVPAALSIYLYLTRDCVT